MTQHKYTLFCAFSMNKWIPNLENRPTKVFFLVCFLKLIDKIRDYHTLQKLNHEGNVYKLQFLSDSLLPMS